MKIGVYFGTIDPGKKPDIIKPYVPIQEKEIKSFVLGPSNNIGLYYSDLNCDNYIYQNWTDLIIGKIQYRKWFMNSKFQPLSREEIEDILTDYDLIAGELKFENLNLRNQFIRSSEENKGIIELGYLKEILSNKYKISKTDFDAYWKRTSMLACNCWIGKREVMKGYFNWLFPILKDCDCLINMQKSDYAKRVVGYIAERLMGFYFSYIKPKTKVYLARHNYVESLSIDLNKKMRFSNV